jgi:ABC-type antimicrobial peptide transport system permease subunit
MLAAYDFAGRAVDTSFSRQYARTLLERLRAIPGVEAAAIARSVPLDIHGLPLTGFTLEGRAQSRAARDEALNNVVTPGYFTVMGIPLRAGSDFADLADASAPPQVIVNEEFVRRFLDGAQALGRRLERSGRTYTIAGVVRNSLYDSFGEPATPIIYFSYRDRPSAGGEIHLRTRVGTEATLAPVAQRIARELDATVSVYDVRTLSEHVEKNLFLKRIPARMFVVLGPLLLVLLAIGIYAVVAYTVARRTAEIGVRLALGATPGVVVAHIVRENLRPIGNGAVLGLLIALLINLHVARGVIYLPLFVGIPALLLLVAAIACWLPARAATRVDPMVALSSE